MDLVSIGYIKSVAIHQYNKYPQIREKINKFFDHFLDKYVGFKYVWYEDKLYVEATNLEKIKNDLENYLNKPINNIGFKSFPPDYRFRFIDDVAARKKVDKKALKKRLEREKKRNKITTGFNDIINKIKSNEEGFRYIGCFDLEFWEKDMNILLEFGWRIEDYHGEGKTTHLIIQDNLSYKNGFYSKNNRFSRKDSKIVPLSIAKQQFKEEFLDKIDVLVGHGLCNDFKVLKMNGVDLDLKYYDTSDIGAALLNRDDKISLEKMLKHLNIEHEDLHNAANDVEFILKVFYELGNL